MKSSLSYTERLAAYEASASLRDLAILKVFQEGVTTEDGLSARLTDANEFVLRMGDLEPNFQQVEKELGRIYREDDLPPEDIRALAGAICAQIYYDYAYPPELAS